MTIKLTDRQRQILDLIRDAIANTGFPPTRAEIAQTLGFKSANAAEDHLKALARKGAIDLTAGASRGIRLRTDGPEGSHPTAGQSRAPGSGASGDLAARISQILLPLVGRVAAGNPILAAEHVEREVGVDPGLFSQQPDFLLKVQGLSMRDAGILDGDLLAVRKAPEARQGQIIVARLGDEVTVKRLHRSGGRIQLLPENPDFSPINVMPDDDFAIEGIAVGLIRTQPLH